MTWAITDRVTRLNFYGCLVLATCGLIPLVMGSNSWILMIGTLLFLAQAWRLAMSRQVRARVDETGITKMVGRRVWRLDWPQVRTVRLRSFLGSTQLVLDTTGDQPWTSSDRLYLLLNRNQVALQVPAAMTADLGSLLAQHDLDLDDSR
ncbi:MAG TPA: hypothetical protein PKD84_06830 [Propionicimonas sp.]|nr:hypothetical protein [Propionicimonas sp.]